MKKHDFIVGTPQPFREDLKINISLGLSIGLNPIFGLCGSGNVFLGAGLCFVRSHKVLFLFLLGIDAF